MNHPISDALTADEARTCLAGLLIAIERHDAGGDTQRLHSDLLAAVELSQSLAHSVPDDASWANYSDIWDEVS